MQKLKLIKSCKSLLLLLGLSLITGTVFAQTRTLTGKVVDEKGEALIGATVRPKSTTTGGGLTDVNGKFVITIPAGESIIRATYIGYIDQDVSINRSSNNITITLATDQKNLNEVVVVGYGQQRRKDVTGSIASISSQALLEVPATNIIQGLQGRLAGIDIQTNSTQPGAAAAIRVRGERSLGTTGGSADSQNGPLVVLDGIPFVGGGINDINPDDIASIDVLKDASATAIYGSRGASGVIIVTTKRGKAGATVVSYNAYAGVSNRIAEYNFFNGQEFADFKKAAGVLNSVNPGTTAYGLTTAEQAGLTNGTNTDWQKIIFRTGFRAVLNGHNSLSAAAIVRSRA
jgi:TonB-dependent SusC/RagA subfamily outer membrane receptor